MKFNNIPTLENVYSDDFTNSVEETTNLNTELNDADSELFSKNNDINNINEAVETATYNVETIDETIEIASDGEKPTESECVVMESMLINIHSRLGLPYFGNNEKNILVSLEDNRDSIFKNIINVITGLFHKVSEFITDILRNTGLIRRKLISLKQRIESSSDWSADGTIKSNIRDFDTVRKLPKLSFNSILISNKYCELYEKALTSLKNNEAIDKDIDNIRYYNSNAAGSIYARDQAAVGFIRMTGIEEKAQRDTSGVDKNNYSELDQDNIEKKQFDAKKLNRKEALQAVDYALDIVNGLKDLEKVKVRFKDLTEKVKFFFDKNFSYKRNDQKAEKFHQRYIVSDLRKLAKRISKAAFQESYNAVRDIIKYIDASMKPGKIEG